MSDGGANKFFRSVCVYYKTYQNRIDFDENSDVPLKKSNR